MEVGKTNAAPTPNRPPVADKKPTKAADAPGASRPASRDQATLSDEASKGEKPGAGKGPGKAGQGKGKGQLKEIRKDVEELKKQMSELNKPGESSGGCQKGGGAPQACNSQQPGAGQEQPQDVNSELLGEAARLMLQPPGGGRPGAGGGCQKGQEGGDARSNLARKYLQAVANPQTAQQIRPETHALVQGMLGIGGGQPGQAPPQKVPGLGNGANPMATGLGNGANPMAVAYASV